MKFLVAILSLLLGAAALFFAVDASGSLQDAPPTHAQTAWTLPCSAAAVLFLTVSVVLFVKTARQGL